MRTLELATAVVLLYICSYGQATSEYQDGYMRVRAGCNGKPEGGQENRFPVIVGQPRLVQSVPNGRLYTVAVGFNETLPIVHLWGTPYQKGYAHGQLMKERAHALINGVYHWVEVEVSKAINGSSIGPIPFEVAKWIADLGLDTALDAMTAFTKNFTGDYFYEEMRGMADAAGLSYDRIRRVHMLGELTKGRCSMFGAWGKQLQDKEGLLTMRALDWVMDGPFRNYPELTVYHAQPGSKENTFLNLGWTGWLGSITGVNDQKLSIHEIGVSYPDETFGGETFAGIPFVFVLRDILQFDKSRVEGVTRLQKANRTCHLILGVGDGKEKRFNSIQYGRDVAVAIDDTNLLPVADWHPPIENTVYYGMDWLCPAFDMIMAQQLQKYKGKLTAEDAIRDVMPIVKTGDLHVYVADLVNDVFWLSVAAPSTVTRGQNAYERPYTRLNLKALWSVTAPTAAELTA